jgi:hypothetical protein
MSTARFHSGLGELPRLAADRTRSISAENPGGEKGAAGRATEGMGARAARDLGKGWKVAPYIEIAPGATCTLADIAGPGLLQSMWFGGSVAKDHSREAILRLYWDEQPQPAVECPLGDFFAAGWGGFAQLTSLTVAVNPNRGLNCFWPMPFRKHCRMTLENRLQQTQSCYYQVNYALAEVPADAAYFHAQFRRTNPLPYGEVYTIAEGIQGRGHYVGTALAYGTNNGGWWGEGEIKFYLDGDGQYPTICGTGMEDYFCGSYGWEVDGRYTSYTTPYAGMHQLVQADGLYRSQQRFGMYRWHIMDPIRFEQDLRVTLQALGWRADGRYLALQDDIASVAFWYQALPTAPFPRLPDRDALELI